MTYELWSVESLNAQGVWFRREEALEALAALCATPAGRTGLQHLVLVEWDGSEYREIASGEALIRLAEDHGGSRVA